MYIYIYMYLHLYITTVVSIIKTIKIGLVVFKNMTYLPSGIMAFLFQCKFHILAGLTQEEGIFHKTLSVLEPFLFPTAISIGVKDTLRNWPMRFLAHLSRRLIGELIVYRSSRRPSVRSHFQT